MVHLEKGLAKLPRAITHKEEPMLDSQKFTTGDQEPGNTGLQKAYLGCRPGSANCLPSPTTRTARTREYTCFLLL